MDNEKIVFDFIAGSRSRSQKGDISKQLYEQGFFGNNIPESLKTRDPNVTGNPVDVKKQFEKQNPN